MTMSSTNSTDASKSGSGGMPSRAERAQARAEELHRKRCEAEASACPPAAPTSEHPHMATLRALRELGAVHITVSGDSLAASFAGPPVVELPPEERPQRNHLSLSETDHDELVRLREEAQMREELGG